jgi:hypothetical protein
VNQLVDVGSEAMAEVAKLIVDPPPDGLSDYLEYFREFVGATRARAQDLPNPWDEMVRSCDHLIRWLPTFQSTPLKYYSNDVAIALTVLPRIRRTLALMVEKPGRKRPPNVFKKTAARVVVTACRRLCWPIGRDALHEVCQAYWEACGAASGDAGDWWRDVTKALKSDHPFFEKLLTAYISR